MRVFAQPFLAPAAGEQLEWRFMRNLKNRFGAFRKDETGASMIEYTVLLSLLTIALLLLVAAVAFQIRNDWVNIRDALIAA
jgi:Flp pilus assembly pilin Flp